MYFIYTKCLEFTYQGSGIREPSLALKQTFGNVQAHTPGNRTVLLFLVFLESDDTDEYNKLIAEYTKLYEH